MIQTQITVPASGPPAWLAEASRAIRITAILLLLIAWFVVVGTGAAATFVRDAVTTP
jgi:hypothetical protein